MNDMLAANQWATRPPDETYKDLNDAEMAFANLEDSSKTRILEVQDIANRLKVKDDGEPVLNGNLGTARFGHDAFRNLCAMAGTPVGLVRELSPDLRVRVLREQLERRAYSENRPNEMKLLVANAGTPDPIISALTSPTYGRVRNSHLASALGIIQRRFQMIHPPALVNPGWTGPTYKIENVPACCNSGNRVMPGDTVRHAGVYGTLTDFFCFMVTDKQVEWKGRQFFLGLICTNSDNWNGAVTFYFFLFDGVCGNHIIWGVSEKAEFRFPHRQKVNNAIENNLHTLNGAFHSWCANDDGRAITLRALDNTTKELAESDDKAVEVIRKRVPNITLDLLKTGQRVCVEVEQLNPRTPFGIVSGITRDSQKCVNFTDRMDRDIAASRILRAFSA